MISSNMVCYINVAIMDDEHLARTRIRRFTEGWSWDIPKPSANNSTTKPLLWNWILSKIHQELLLKDKNAVMPDPNSVTVKSRILITAETPSEFDKLINERTQSHNLDIILSDIVVPGEENGLGFAKRWQNKKDAPVFIMISAFSEHAVDAFELDVAGYVVKPVRSEVLGEALCRACTKKATRDTVESEWGQDLSNIIKQQKDSRAFLTVNVSGKLTNILVEDVLMFKADMKYTMIITKNKQYISEISLKKLEELYYDKFIKVHRSYLVSLDYIDGLYSEQRKSLAGLFVKGRVWYIKLDGIEDEKIEVSRRAWSNISKILGINPLAEYKKDFVNFSPEQLKKAKERLLEFKR